MGSATLPSSRAKEVWWSCFSSAFRTALACTIVGLATLYGPQCIKRQVGYPAFSYVTVILIVTDASLGDTLRGCWLGIYATIQSVIPSIICLRLIGPARLNATTTAMAVAMSTFVVVLPESTHLIAKRIALGQIVLIYVIGFIKGPEADPIMHPVHVAISTAVGVLACVLALLFPYPDLASCQVKKNCKLFTENAWERLQLFVKAFCAEDVSSAVALISQGKILSFKGSKNLQIIKLKQESMQWERFPLKFLRPYGMNPSKTFQGLDFHLRGLEISLENSLPVIDQNLKDVLLKQLDQCGQTFKQQVFFIRNSPTVPETNPEKLFISLPTLETLPHTHKDLPAHFFLFCLKLLHRKPVASSDPPKPLSTKNNTNLISDLSGRWAVNKKRLMPAFKASVSLGLAVLFGLLYSKDDGYWSGLPVAISLAGAREATFKVANIKAQGTVLGTVYGVLGCFVLERYVKIRFISLLPWFIFTSFLRRSRMYGQAGGISAVIGAVLILGRKDFGTPSNFAIARIVETFIGLSCSIMVELFLQPTRSSSLAKIQLFKSLHALHKCVGAVSIGASKTELEDRLIKARSHLNKLKQLIGEADAEPNFWFLPFHSGCYSKLSLSLSKMVDLLLFCSHAIEESQAMDALGAEAAQNLETALLMLKNTVSIPLKCFEEIVAVKSISALDEKLKKNNLSYDIELGKASGAQGMDEIDKNITSFLRNSNDVLVQVCSAEGNENGLALSIGTLAFCMGSMAKETLEIEKAIRELLQWENPSSQINLHEISCKVHALFSS